MNRGADPRRNSDSPKLRVLHVIHRLALGGTEYGVIKVVNHLDRDRFQPSICSLLNAFPEGVAALRSDVPVTSLERAAGFQTSVLYRLADLMRDQRIDIVHSHNWTTYLYAVIAASMARVPVVIHGEHGRETAEVSKETRRRLLERMLAGRVDHFTAVSRDLCEHIATDWKVRRSRIRFIPNGIELARYEKLPELAAARAGMGLPESAQVIGTIGNFRDVKDFASLVAAFAIVRRDRPRARLAMAGIDPDRRFATRMEREMPNWDELSRSVSFLGVRTDVPQLLAGFDVYVNSSIYEGMSNTILEAMAARRPVVATRVGGTPDLVEDGVTGWMVPSKDPERLAERIAWVLDHPEEGKAMGLAGRRRVEERHSFPEMVAGNARLYEAVYARKRAPWRGSHRARSLAGGAARWSGALSIRRAIAPPSLSVLAYHNVLPYADGRDRPGEAMRVASEIFEEQMDRLASRYHPMGAAEVAEHFAARRPFPRGAVWVTFDDGYVDNYRHAFPILRRFRIPATIFLVTDRMDHGGSLWWDDLAESVRRLDRGGAGALRDAARAVGDQAGRLLEDVAAGTTSWTNGVDRAISLLNTLEEDRRLGIVESLRSAADGLDPSPRPRLMLGWEEVRAMRAGGVTFGSHTASHAFLDTLPIEGADAELEKSIARIESETGEPPISMAYPRGRSSEATRRLLEKRGIRLAVTTMPGANSLSTDPLALKRRDAGYLALGPRFSPGLFDLEISGWFDGGRR
ncbi:MAG TPA: glycosyltransferase [Candidatus Eisenbacteria bacterium]|nr:glycosyltransferase [Candidatus Eisenbacteria bacterium]